MSLEGDWASLGSDTTVSEVSGLLDHPSFRLSSGHPTFGLVLGGTEVARNAWRRCLASKVPGNGERQ